MAHPMAQKTDDGARVVATNRKAYHDYFIEEKLEAGIVLTGTEVKSLRDGKVNLRESYASIARGEIFLHQCHISPYSHGNIANHDPVRTRKLLLHRKQIEKLLGKTQQKGLTLIPMDLYFRKGYAKLTLAVAKGRKLYDKREKLRRRTQEREAERAMRERT